MSSALEQALRAGGVAQGDPHVPRLAEGVAAGHEHAGARQARDQLAAVDARVGDPQEVRLAVGHLEVALAQRGGQRDALGGDQAHALGDELRAAAQRLQRARLGDLGDAEVGRELGEQLLRAGRAERVADAQPRQAPGLREAAEHEQPRMVLEQLQRAVGRLGVGELDERLVEQHGDALGQAVEQPRELAGGQQLAGRVVGAGERDHARVLSASCAAASSASTPPLTGTARPWARRAMIG